MFSEVENVEFEHEIAFSATFFRAFLTRKCNARTRVINGAITQENFQEVGWIKQNNCEIRDGLGTEKS